MSVILKGHSGCRLEVIYSGNKTIVRKTSKSIEYNPRLYLQAEKQLSCSFDGFYTPQIYNVALDKAGLCYIDMEYIPGVSVANLLIDMQVDKIKELVRKLLTIRTEVYQPAANTDREIFLNKILSINTSLHLINDKYVFESAIHQLNSYHWQIEKTFNCHGDLTFENILYWNDKIYLIDYLDTFFNSWKIDAAKILQDLESKWSFRDQSELPQNLIVRLKIFKQIFFEELLFMGMTFKDYSDLYHILLLSLLRIVPYSIYNQHTMLYLKSEVSKCLQNIAVLENTYENINNSLRR